jgi:predicted RNA-binding Zn-ribbon protein involved in translation (DUF1610 family)
MDNDIVYSHETFKCAATGSNDELTVLWLADSWPCPQCGVLSLYDDRMPLIFDASGVGEWTAFSERLCHQCGTRVDYPTAIYAGHLVGDELNDAIETLQQDVLDYRARFRRRLEYKVREQLLGAMRQLIAHGKDPSTLLPDDLEELDLDTGSMTEPGVWINPDSQVLEAWDYDLDGEIIAVSLDE